MTASKAQQQFQQRVRQRMREGWQLVSRSDDPPRARLRRKADAQGRRVAARAEARLFEHVYRELWIDEDGTLHDEEVGVEN